MTMVNSVKGVSDERRAKKNLGTNRKIRRKIKLDEREADERVPSRQSLHIPSESFTVHKKTGRHSKTGTRNRISEQRNQWDFKKFLRILRCLSILFPQHQTFRARPTPSQRAAKSRFNTFPRFRPVKRLHRRCPVSREQIYCHVSFRFDSDSC